MQTLNVQDAHRINGLSLIPGGHKVRVIYKHGPAREYDKVKNPTNYIRKILKADASSLITEILVDGLQVWNVNSVKK